MLLLKGAFCFFFERGEIRLSLVNRCIVCVMCDVCKRYLVRDMCYNVCCMLLGRYGLMSMWHSRARSGLRKACWDGEGRECQGYVFVYLWLHMGLWDCLIV